MANEAGGGRRMRRGAHYYVYLYRHRRKFNAHAKNQPPFYKCLLFIGHIKQYGTDSKHVTWNESHGLLAQMIIEYPALQPEDEGQPLKLNINYCQTELRSY